MGTRGSSFRTADAVGPTYETREFPANALDGSLATVVALGTGLLIVVGVVATGGNPVMAVAPPLVVGLLFVLARVPLRWSATVLVFLILSLEISTDAHGIWASPLVHIGDLLGYGFSNVSRLPVAGFEVVTVVLLAIAAFRRATRPDFEGRRAVQTAGVMRSCIILLVAGCLFAVGMSLLNGHGLALWKVRYLLHIPMFFLLFQTTLRHPEDFHAIGLALVAAAQVKALIAAYVQLVVAPKLTGGMLATATNHGDSILFALAVLVLVISVLETWTWRSIVWAAILLPLPIWGMVLNGRRLVWAILAMAMVVVFLCSSWRPWKSRIVRISAISAPLLLAYLAIGWNNTQLGGLFVPIAKIRTMLDSKVDHSTLWRERETWNIAVSIRESSILGIGLGGEYVEHMFNDDISQHYADYKGWPHNTILGLLLLAGLPGFAALWLPYLFVVFLAVRAERFSRTLFERIAAAICIASVVACLAVAWGDTGSHFIQYKLAAALSMSLASKLAVATGAWPQSRQTA
ncbi:MAG TPA: O-antigen ligase family protein [Vulgatibacter sp.]|nr:O-antigen ligase family protein [Vulgatibacter sp.]